MRTPVPVMVVALLVLVGCGANENPAINTPAPSSTSASSACANFAPVPGTATIAMRDNVFDPSCLTVAASQPVTLENRGTAVHNLSIVRGEIEIDVQPGSTKDLDPLGGTLSPGSYPFFCRFHRALGMRGTIVVVET